jgi:SAM-dependent methyltransferase
MEPDIAAQLIDLNRRFYADFGPPFSATRGRIQPGVRRIISQLNNTEHILDLGCGNGQLARTLAEAGHRGSYLGLDFSPPLLQDAEHQPEGFSIKFLLSDLTSSDWASNLPTFNRIFSFAVLHHIPSHALRLGMLQKIRGLLAPGGKFVHSHWQFRNSEKLTARIQPWERAQLTAADVDPGDTLLDWRSEGHGLRYVHHFSEQELSDLASESGFSVVESFLSDGANGKLGLYQTWEGI